MKVCPVCGARAFDDALTCYGCLYRFNEEERAERHSAAEAQVSAENCEAPCGEDDAKGVGERGVIRTDRLEFAPSFLIRFTPIADEAGCLSWSCAIEAG